MTPEASSRDPIGRAFQVIAWMVDHGHGAWGVRDIASGTALPAATTHRLLTSLERLSLVERVNGLYTLGLEMHRLGQRVASRANVSTIAESFMRELVAECDEQIYLCLFDRHRPAMMFGRTVEASDPLRYTIEQYRWEPVHAGASGMAILAFLPSEELDEVLGTSALPKLTLDTITDPVELRATLADIAARGYAISHGQRTKGAVGIAAPVFDQHDRVIADVVMTIPDHRYDNTRERELSQAVMRCADQISERLGSTRQSHDTTGETRS
jgi:DNA-binding IclR family transcriptional regulator